MKKFNKQAIWLFDMENPPYDSGDVKPSVIYGEQLHGPDNYKGVDWTEFILWCQEPGPSYGNKVIYFHNLSYDGAAVIHELKELEISFENITTDLSSKHIQIKTNGCEFRCSWLILTSSVEAIGQWLEKEKGIDFKKGDYNYSKIERYNNWNEVPQELVDYTIRDVQIVKIFFLEMWDFLTEKDKLPPLTIGGVALLNLRKTIGQKWFNELVGGKWYDEPPKLETYDEKLMWYINTLDTWNKSYLGGITCGKEELKGKDLKGPIYGYDINSSYPAIMLNKDLPYGRPLKEKPNGKSICFLLVKFKKVKSKSMNNLPIFAITKRVFADTAETWIRGEWEAKNKNYIIRWVPEFEFEALKESYFMEYDILNTRWYRASKYLAKFVKKYADLKMNSTGATKQSAKLLLNNSYGKLGQKLEMRSKVYDLDKVDNHWPARTITDIKDLRQDNSHLPVSMCITAWARLVLYEACKHNNWIYVDTDSIKCFGEAKNIEIDTIKLGAWKIENDDIETFKFFKPKCYGYINNTGKNMFAISGVPKKKQKELAWKDFYIGKEITKLQACRKLGYICLKETTYKI